jgi:hypothetical protein
MFANYTIFQYMLFSYYVKAILLLICSIFTTLNICCILSTKQLFLMKIYDTLYSVTVTIRLLMVENHLHYLYANRANCRLGRLRSVFFTNVTDWFFSTKPTRRLFFSKNYTKNKKPDSITNNRATAKSIK